MTVDRGLQADAVGLAFAAFGGGSLLGALASSRVVKGRIGRLMMLGTAVTGVTTVILALVTFMPAILALSFLAGLGESFVLVSYITLRAGLTPDSLLGRIGSTTRTVSLGLQPVGMLAGGILLDLAGGGRTLMLFGVAIVLLSGIAALFPVLRDASISRPQPAPPDERGRIEHAEELPTGP
jgi:MFS family permease